MVNQKTFNIYSLSILKLGINPKMELTKQKEITLLNMMCLLILISFILISLIGFLFDFRLTRPLNLIGYLISVFLVFGVYFLQYLQKYTLAKTLFVLSNFISCTIFHLYITPDIEVEFYYIITPLLSIIIFNSKWISLLNLSVGIILFFEFYNFNSEIEYDRLHFICFFFTLFTIVYFLKNINQQNEAKLKNQQFELRELNKFKSHFFVNLSHEIRTPLTLIQGYTNQIDLKASEEVNTAKLDIVKAQCKQMQDIIDSIMDLSKIESSELQLTPTYINLQTFLEKHFTDFQGVFTKKNIDFQLNNEVENTSILIDQDLFSKAVNNLLSNALKFTDTGGVVSVNANFINKLLILEIKDNGIGIPEDEIEFVYKRFYQVKNDITDSQGSGVGLAFTKSIVDAHHFSIKLNSIYGVGTSFSILIPSEYTKSYNDSSGEQEPSLPHIAETTDTVLSEKPNLKNRKKILLLEDHEPMRLYLKEVLKKYTITQAENGKEALEILKHTSFDLIITDYMMPIMDGEEFVNQLKKKQDKTPIIVLTARTDAHGKLSMLRLGIDGYLHKPFMEEELLINVSNSLKLYENVKEFDENNSASEVKALNTHVDKFNTKITSYIDKNITSHLLTVDTIADYMNVSRSTLNRKSKSLLGQTVNQLIVEVRLAKARNLRLENPLATKKEIAQAVGVSNTTYLFNNLKERYGIQ